MYSRPMFDWRSGLSDVSGFGASLWLLALCGSIGS